MSVRQGSWFSGSNFTLEELVLFSYNWAIGVPQKNLIDMLGLSSKSATDWCTFCREVVEEYMIRGADGKQIGGKDVIVEINESMLEKRKYNRGRMAEDQWVFCGKERENRKNIFMVPVPDRSSNTIVSLIEHYIAPGSIIISDCWQGYNRISPFDYIHLTVNHSIKFKDPETGAHTNNIDLESLMAKEDMPSFGQRHKMIESYLASHLWRVQVKGSGDDFFTAFLDAASTVYDPKTWDVPAV